MNEIQHHSPNLPLELNTFCKFCEDRVSFVNYVLGNKVRKVYTLILLKVGESQMLDPQECPLNSIEDFLSRQNLCVDHCSLRP